MFEFHCPRGTSRLKYILISFLICFRKFVWEVELMTAWVELMTAWVELMTA